MLGLRVQQFRLVVIYQYDDRVVEIPGTPTSLAAALWLLAENERLNGESEHVLSARVYSDQDYEQHLMRRVAEALVIS